MFIENKNTKNGEKKERRKGEKVLSRTRTRHIWLDPTIPTTTPQSQIL